MELIPSAPMRNADPAAQRLDPAATTTFQTDASAGACVGAGSTATQATQATQAYPIIWAGGNNWQSQLAAVPRSTAVVAIVQFPYDRRDRYAPVWLPRADGRSTVETDYLQACQRVLRELRPMVANEALVFVADLPRWLPFHATTLEELGLQFRHWIAVAMPDQPGDPPGDSPDDQPGDSPCDQPGDPPDDRPEHQPEHQPGDQPGDRLGDWPDPPKRDVPLVPVHAGILMYATSPGVSLHQVREPHWFCHRCGLPLADWGGKKANRNPAGRVISDVWIHGPFTPAEILRRLLGLAGLELVDGTHVRGVLPVKPPHRSPKGSEGAAVWPEPAVIVVHPQFDLQPRRSVNPVASPPAGSGQPAASGQPASSGSAARATTGSGQAASSGSAARATTGSGQPASSGSAARAMTGSGQAAASAQPAASRSALRLPALPPSQRPPFETLPADPREPLTLDTLYQADVVDALRRLPDACIDLAFADPPYNLEKEYSHYDDDRADPEYLRWCERWLNEYVRVLKPSGSLFVVNLPRWAVHHASFLTQQPAPLYFQHWIAWDALSEPRGRIMPAHYAILYYTKSPTDFVFHPQRAYPPDYCFRAACVRQRNPSSETVPLADVWYDVHRIRHRRDRDAHPCQLPVSLLQRIIQMTTDPGQVVLDGFAGTGSAVVTAYQLGRHFIGIDIDPKYLAITAAKQTRLAPAAPLVDTGTAPR